MGGLENVCCFLVAQWCICFILVGIVFWFLSYQFVTCTNQKPIDQYAQGMEMGLGRLGGESRSRVGDRSFESGEGKLGESEASGTSRVKQRRTCCLSLSLVVRSLNISSFKQTPYKKWRCELGYTISYLQVPQHFHTTFNIIVALR